MPATINKQRLLAQVFALKNRYQPAGQEERPVLEQYLYAICREGATRAQADRAFRNLHERFFDWNEVRVSSPHEVAEALGDIPDAEARAARLTALLQEVFETTFSFDLSSIQKKGLKQATRQLGRFQGASDYAVAWVVQQALGGHAIPVDAPAMRVLRRMGLLDAGQTDPEAVRVALEHLVPKVRGPLFCELISAVADEFCQDDEPRCSACPIAGECQTGQETTRRPSARGSRPKPR